VPLAFSLKSIFPEVCRAGNVPLAFQQQHNLKDEYKAKDLLPILEKNNAYGFERFKSLITF